MSHSTVDGLEETLQNYTIKQTMQAKRLFFDTSGKPIPDVSFNFCFNIYVLIVNYTSNEDSCGPLKGLKCQDNGRWEHKRAD
jgi:hypothetical protein